MSQLYFRVTKSVNDKGELYPEETPLDSIVNDSEKDWYKSIYYYNEDQKTRFYEEVKNEKSGKVDKRGCAGIAEVLTDKLVWDLDAEGDLESSQKDTQELVSRLDKSGLVPQIFFSGNKGFGVEVALDSYITVKEFADYVDYFAKDLKTFDTTIRNASRILRVCGTKHEKTGLYKSELELDELGKNIAQIKEYSKNSYLSNEPVLNGGGALPKIPLRSSEKPSKSIIVRNDLRLAEKPKWLSNWKYAIMEGYFPPGTRHHALMALGATLKNQGIHKAIAGRMLKGAVELQCARFDSEKYDKNEIWRCIEDIFDPNWNGGTYSEDDFPGNLKEYFDEQGIARFSGTEDPTALTDIGSAFDAFTSYAENIDENSLSFGLPELDKVLKTKLGYLTGLLAPPGVGKTSCALTILSNTSRQGLKSIFFSYDMYKNVLIQKILQRETGLTEDDLYEIYKAKDYEQIEKFKMILNKHYSNVDFCFKSSQSMDELKESIYCNEQKTGEKIKLVVVDYLEIVRAKVADPTQASMEIIQGLREIANEGRVVLILLQPNKISSKPNMPLLSYNSAKGSSSIAQAVTQMLTCHRPGMSSITPENDNYFGINVVKNRMGVLAAVDFHWTGLTGKIRPLEDIERQELQDIRRALNEADADERGGL